ncbi:MAG: murein L,D-transpeptidase catalytic domain-containing protein, partial [Myxococcota bacterium]
PSIRRLTRDEIKDAAYGFQDPWAALLQEELSAVLGRDIPADGLPGAGTEQAIVEFNTRYGIPGDKRVFGPGAWAKLIEVRGGPDGLRPEWHHEFDRDSITAQLTAAVAATGDEISPRAIETLTRAYDNFLNTPEGVLVRNPLVYLADYGQRYATTERGWIFDLSRGELVEGPFHIAHGRGSDARDGGAHRISGDYNAEFGSSRSPFSDQPEGHKNNLGLFTTRPRHYQSVNFNAAGLRLDGRSQGFNHRSLDRDVLVHGAWYVDPENGHHGRSLSCQAMSVKRANRLLPQLTSAVVFNYAPVPSWLEGDPLLQD